ncbi:unnamed protein product [Lactuca virosa]|uniref:Uncharacterized protein n=1 Tax=Lactuca virosa TaxID=75947 RepID=A0AAU9P708_9ASTR|nr:unnamed protein product [Lactuca virosa]
MAKLCFLWCSFGFMTHEKENNNLKHEEHLAMVMVGNHLSYCHPYLDSEQAWCEDSVLRYEQLFFERQGSTQSISYKFILLGVKLNWLVKNCHQVSMVEWC